MNRYTYIVLFILALVSCQKEVSEFQSNNFIKYFGTGYGAGSYGYDIAELQDGYILVGYDNTAQYNRQAFIIKSNSAGNTVWQSRYGSMLQEEGRRIHVLGDQFYILGISTNEFTGIRNSFIMGIGPDGDSLSRMSFGTTEYSLVTNDFYVGNDFFYVAGESYHASANEPNSYLAKYSHSGDTIWQRTFRANGSQRISRLFLNQDGNFIIVGTDNQMLGSDQRRITIGEVNQHGSPTRFHSIASETELTFGDAAISDSKLYITYNEQTDDLNEASIACISLADFSTLWQQTGLPLSAKAISVSDNGIVTLAGQRDDQIMIYQLNSDGEITLNAQDVKTPVGVVEKIVSTSDRGLALIGATGSDFGTMLQVIKTDKELFLFEP